MRKDVCFRRKELSKAGDSNLWSVKTDLLRSLGSRVFNDFILIRMGGAFSTFYLSIQMAAAVSRAFYMVLIGLSYMGNDCRQMHLASKMEGWLCIYMDLVPTHSGNHELQGM